MLYPYYFYHHNYQYVTSKTVILYYYFPVDVMSMGKNMVKELLGAFPGIDEAMSFAEVMR